MSADELLELDPIVRAALAGELDMGEQRTDAQVLERMREQTRRVRERVAAEQLEEVSHERSPRRERRARRSGASNRKRKRTSEAQRDLKLQATGAVPLVGRLRDVGFVQLLRKCVEAQRWMRDEQPRGEKWLAMNTKERASWQARKRSTEARVLKAMEELLVMATPDESIDRDAAARRPIVA